jgi:hypothetical protein
VLLRSSLKIGIKAATLGALSGAELGDVASAVADEASDLEDRFIEGLLTKQKEQRETIEAFREALAALPALLSSDDAKPHPTGSPKPLTMIIDELDRCRPIFALEILERIKHFFAVPHVHFVLGAHLQQLQNSVKAAYGADIDAQAYLQKFIQLTLHLVDDKRHRHERVATKYVEHLAKSLKFKPQDRDILEVVTTLVRHVAESRGLSLRAIEQVFTVLAVALAFRPERHLCPDTILGGLCVLKVIDAALYVKAKAGTITFDEAKRSLALGALADQQDKIVVEHVARFWEYCTDPSPSTEVRNRYNEALAQFGVTRDRIVPLVANSIVDRLVVN